VLLVDRCETNKSQRPCDCTDGGTSRRHCAVDQKSVCCWTIECLRNSALEDDDSNGQQRQHPVCWLALQHVGRDAIHTVRRGRPVLSVRSTAARLHSTTHLTAVSDSTTITWPSLRWHSSAPTGDRKCWSPASRSTPSWRHSTSPTSTTSRSTSKDWNWKSSERWTGLGCRSTSSRSSIESTTARRSFSRRRSPSSKTSGSSSTTQVSTGK